MSWARLQLVKVINDYTQVSEDEVADLLNLIQAPPTFQSIVHHILLLPEVFEAASNIAEVSEMDTSRYRKAFATSKLLAHVVTKLEDDRRLTDFQVPVPTHRFGPCQGLLGTHPLYSALAETIPDKKYHYKFVQLVAQILLAMDSLGTLDGELLDILNAPFATFRALTKPTRWIFLQDLPDTPVPVTTFADIVKTTFRKTGFQSIKKIFEVAEDPLRRKKRLKKKPTVRKPKPLKQIREDDEDAAAAYLKDILPTADLTQKELEAYIEHGGFPEAPGSDCDLEPVLNTDQYQGPTLKQLAFQAKQNSNRRAMLNQFSALAWNQANLFDLKVLFEFFEGKNLLDDFEFYPLTREDVIVILGLMFFTSNSLNRVLSLPLFPGGDPLSESVKGIFHKKGHLIQVQLDSPGPKLSNKVNQPGAFQVNDFSIVQLPLYFSRCLENIGDPLSNGPSRAFLIDSINPADEANVNSAHSILLRVMGRLNSESGARLSLGRISSYLLFRVAEAEKCDLPGAMLYFGRNDKIALTRIHYTLAESKHLESTYRNCINNLLGSLGHTERFTVGDSCNSSVYLGTPFCPKEATVIKLVKDLQAKLETKTLSIVDHHNYYTLYTSMMISYGTGYRAIHDPSLKEVEIDFQRALGVISDKGSADYRTRYVYLAPVLLNQIRFYREHVQAIYAHLGVVNPSLFNLVKTNNGWGVPLNFFWLSGNLEPLELLSPTKAKEILKVEFNYSIRLNAGRHFLKYHLIGAGCSPELVEAQLGHWEAGQEPWGPYSNLDPLDFANQMSTFIPDIMENSGWRAFDRNGND